jgi:hypothetical protein
LAVRAIGPNHPQFVRAGRGYGRAVNLFQFIKVMYLPNLGHELAASIRVPLAMSVSRAAGTN